MVSSEIDRKHSTIQIRKKCLPRAPSTATLLSISCEIVDSQYTVWFICCTYVCELHSYTSLHYTELSWGREYRMHCGLLLNVSIDLPITFCFIRIHILGIHYFVHEFEVWVNSVWDTDWRLHWHCHCHWQVTDLSWVIVWLVWLIVIVMTIFFLIKSKVKLY